MRAQQAVLKREVDGLRDIVARLERHEPMLPADDVAIAVDERLLHDIIEAQLPLEVDVERFHLSLPEVDVFFRGSPVIRLRGRLSLVNRPGIVAAVTVVGALEQMAVNASTSTLNANIAIDHLSIDQVAGLETFLSGSTLEGVAEMVRLEVKEQMPPVQIPVHVQQTIDLPAVTRGPVRIDGAQLPLAVSVSQVVATRGLLWIAVHFAPGNVVKTVDAPEAGDATAAATGVSLNAADAAPAGTAAAPPPARAPVKGK